MQKFNTKDYVIFHGGDLVFTPSFFYQCLSDWFAGEKIILEEAAYIPPQRKSNEFALKVPKGLTCPIGVQHYHLVFSINGKKQAVEVITKSKISDEKYLEVISGAFEKCGIVSTERPIKDYLKELEFSNLNKKEVAVYQMQKQFKSFQQNMPQCYGIYFSEKEGACVLILQRLEDAWLSLDPFNTAKWEAKAIETLLKASAEIHAEWYGKEKEIIKINGFAHYATVEKMKNYKAYWEALANAVCRAELDSLTKEDYRYHDTLIAQIPEWYKIISNATKTLVQNDCVPKNVALNDHPTPYKAYIYDWEISTLHVPARDVIEFLSYVLPSSFSYDLLTHYLTLHRTALEKACQQILPADRWNQECLAAAKDFLLQRLLPQLPFEKLEARNIMHVYRNVRRMITFLECEGE